MEARVAGEGAAEARLRPGLDALGGFLRPDRAARARRLLCAGKTPEQAHFFRRGIGLSKQELHDLGEWLAHYDLTCSVERVERSADGSEKLAVRLADGELTETVAMAHGTACVSSQVGCAVGCRFCASGLDGVKRHLSADEVVEQAIHARRRMPIDRIVYMGMGEPSHNLDNVLEAVRRMQEELRIGARRQNVSTVGSVAAIEQMGRAPVKPCLAISLHTADETLRRELMPRTHRDSLRDVLAAAEAYRRIQTIPIQLEWTLLRGVNDEPEQVRAACALIQDVGIKGYINFILWNPVPDLPFERPELTRARELVALAKELGVLATVRASAGQDVAAACGQLRRGSLNPSE